MSAIAAVTASPMSDAIQHASFVQEVLELFLAAGKLDDASETSKLTKSLKRTKREYGGKGGQGVLQARYALGSSSDFYLSSVVVPLQTTSIMPRDNNSGPPSAGTTSDTLSTHSGLYPELDKAGRAGVLLALRQDAARNIDSLTHSYKAVWADVLWLLDMPEVLDYVRSYLSESTDASVQQASVRDQARMFELKNIDFKVAKLVVEALLKAVSATAQTEVQRQINVAVEHGTQHVAEAVYALAKSPEAQAAMSQNETSIANLWTSFGPLFGTAPAPAPAPQPAPPPAPPPAPAPAPAFAFAVAPAPPPAPAPAKAGAAAAAPGGCGNACTNLVIDEKTVSNGNCFFDAVRRSMESKDGLPSDSRKANTFRVEASTWLRRKSSKVKDQADAWDALAGNLVDYYEMQPDPTGIDETFPLVVRKYVDARLVQEQRVDLDLFKASLMGVLADLTLAGMQDGRYTWAESWHAVALSHVLGRRICIFEDRGQGGTPSHFLIQSRIGANMPTNDPICIESNGVNHFRAFVKQEYADKQLLAASLDGAFPYSGKMVSLGQVRVHPLVLHNAFPGLSHTVFEQSVKRQPPPIVLHVLRAESKRMQLPMQADTGALVLLGLGRASLGGNTLRSPGSRSTTTVGDQNAESLVNAVTRRGYDVENLTEGRRVAAFSNATYLANLTKADVLTEDIPEAVFNLVDRLASDADVDSTLAKEQAQRTRAMDNSNSFSGVFGKNMTNEDRTYLENQNELSKGGLKQFIMSRGNSGDAMQPPKDDEDRSLFLSFSFAIANMFMISAEVQPGVLEAIAKKTFAVHLNDGNILKTLLQSYRPNTYDGYIREEMQAATNGLIPFTRANKKLQGIMLQVWKEQSLSFLDRSTDTKWKSSLVDLRDENLVNRTRDLSGDKAAALAELALDTAKKLPEWSGSGLNKTAFETLKQANNRGALLQAFRKRFGAGSAPSSVGAYSIEYVLSTLNAFILNRDDTLGASTQLGKQLIKDVGVDAKLMEIADYNIVELATGTAGRRAMQDFLESTEVESFFVEDIVPELQKFFESQSNSLDEDSIQAIESAIQYTIDSAFEAKINYIQEVVGKRREEMETQTKMITVSLKNTESETFKFFSSKLKTEATFWYVKSGKFVDMPILNVDDPKARGDLMQHVKSNHKMEPSVAAWKDKEQIYILKEVNKNIASSVGFKDGVGFKDDNVYFYPNPASESFYASLVAPATKAKYLLDNKLGKYQDARYTFMNALAERVRKSTPYVDMQDVLTIARSQILVAFVDGNAISFPEEYSFPQAPGKFLQAFSYKDSAADLKVFANNKLIVGNTLEDGLSVLQAAELYISKDASIQRSVDQSTVARLQVDNEPADFKRSKLADAISESLKVKKGLSNAIIDAVIQSSGAESDGDVTKELGIATAALLPSVQREELTLEDATRMAAAGMVYSNPGYWSSLSGKQVQTVITDNIAANIQNTFQVAGLILKNQIDVVTKAGDKPAIRILNQIQTELKTTATDKGLLAEFFSTAINVGVLDAFLAPATTLIVGKATNAATTVSVSAVSTLFKTLLNRVPQELQDGARQALDIIIQGVVTTGYGKVTKFNKEMNEWIEWMERIGEMVSLSPSEADVIKSMCKEQITPDVATKVALRAVQQLREQLNVDAWGATVAMMVRRAKRFEGLIKGGPALGSSATLTSSVRNAKLAPPSAPPSAPSPPSTPPSPFSNGDSDWENLINLLGLLMSRTADAKGAFADAAATASKIIPDLSRFVISAGATTADAVKIGRVLGSPSGSGGVQNWMVGSGVAFLMALLVGSTRYRFADLYRRIVGTSSGSGPGGGGSGASGRPLCELISLTDPLSSDVKDGICAALWQLTDALPPMIDARLTPLWNFSDDPHTHELHFDKWRRAMSCDLVPCRAAAMLPQHAALNYCMLRGLCGMRAPHQVDGSTLASNTPLRYSLPSWCRLSGLAPPSHSSKATLPYSGGVSSMTRKEAEEVTRFRSAIDTRKDSIQATNIGGDPDVAQRLQTISLDKVVDFVSLNDEDTVGTGVVMTTAVRDPARSVMWMPSEIERETGFVSIIYNDITEAAGEAVVREHLIDYYGRVKQANADSHKGATALMLRCATKFSQLKYMHVLACAQPEDLSVLNRDGCESYQTRPAVRCSSESDGSPGAVLYPCDAGLAKRSNNSFYNAYYGFLNAANTYDLLDTTQGCNIQSVIRRDDATRNFRAWLSTQLNMSHSVPLYIASAVASPLRVRSTSRADGWGGLQSLSMNDRDRINIQGLRDMLAGIRAIQDTLDTLECEVEAVKRMQEHGSGDPMCPDDDQDRATEARRGALWGDALREVALCGDRYYRFVQHLSGTIAEGVEDVVVIDQSRYMEQQRQLQQQRRAAAEQASKAQLKLVQDVFAAVLKDSGLVMGMRNGGALQDITVLSSTLRDQALKLANGGGASSFFTNAVDLTHLLASGTGEMSLQTLFDRLRVVGTEIQHAALSAIPSAAGDSSMSLEFLNMPRNSLMLRWKPEALAAVRRTFNLLLREVANAGCHCGYVRDPTAYELIEGVNGELSNAFAETCAYVLASSRMAAPAYVPYINVASRAALGKQAGVSLKLLTRRWYEYAMRHRAPDFSQDRSSYFR